MSKCITDIIGTKTRWVNDSNKLHREGGPALEYDNGTKYWYFNGELHREDGPACEYSDGTKIWFLNGVRHRIGGPAFYSLDGVKFWYVNGLLHREDGPAVDGRFVKEYFYNGKKIICYSNKEFFKLIKMKAFW